jgi:hypothetical protein
LEKLIYLDINMTKKLLRSISIAIALSGCASTSGAYHNPTEKPRKIQNPEEELRKISLNKVRGYASETRLYLERNGQEETIAAAQDSAKRILKDPDSAKFQNLRIAEYDGGSVVCGEINAKNSYGGYVGYKQFVAGVSGATILDTSSRYPEINDTSNAGINAACGY